MTSRLNNIVARFTASADAALAAGRSPEHLQELMTEVGAYVADTVHFFTGSIPKKSLRNRAARIAARSVPNIVLEIYQEGGVGGDVMHAAEQAAVEAFSGRFAELQATAIHEGGAHA